MTAAPNLGGEPNLHATDYAEFRATHARQVLTIGASEWIFYDSGPNSGSGSCPLICLPGASGTCNVFFRQVIELSKQGNRVLSVQWPPFWTHNEWVHGFHLFLNRLQIKRTHFFGASLGGFLALLFAEQCPANVESIVVCNSFCDTSFFYNNSPCRDMFNYMPEFMLKKFLLDNFPQGLLDHDIADSVDFMVLELESLNHKDVASRLWLNCSKRQVGDLKLPASRLTGMGDMHWGTCHALGHMCALTRHCAKKVAVCVCCSCALQ